MARRKLPVLRSVGLPCNVTARGAVSKVDQRTIVVIFPLLPPSMLAAYDSVSGEIAATLPAYTPGAGVSANNASMAFNMRE